MRHDLWRGAFGRSFVLGAYSSNTPWSRSSSINSPFASPQDCWRRLSALARLWIGILCNSHGLRKDGLQRNRSVVCDGIVHERTHSQLVQSQGSRSLDGGIVRWPRRGRRPAEFDDRHFGMRVGGVSRLRGLRSSLFAFRCHEELHGVSSLGRWSGFDPFCLTSAPMGQIRAI